ncbi:MAG: hemoglobin [Planctomycetota bacterium]|jgi:hemoglobin
MNQSTYERIGGFPTVRKVVLEFYDRVLDEAEVQPFFAETDMESLIDHQTKFWASLLGGPVSYTQDQMRLVHLGMEIQDSHFDLVAEIAVEVLEDHGIGADEIEAASTALEALRLYIVEESSE